MRGQPSVALEAGRRLGEVAEQEVRERHAPGGVVGEAAVAEAIQRRLQRGEALLEAPAVVVEPAREVLRLGRPARARELGDDLAVAGDRLVVAVGARQRPRAVELRRRRLVAASRGDRRQQQLARPSRSRAACGTWSFRSGSRARRPGRAAASTGSFASSASASSQWRSFVSASARRSRSAGASSLARAAAGRVVARRRRRGGRRGRPSRRSASIGQRVGREVARDRQELLARARPGRGRRPRRRCESGPARRRRSRAVAVLDQPRVGGGGLRAVALHPQAIGGAERRHLRRARRRPRAELARTAPRAAGSRRRRTHSRRGGTAPSPRCAAPCRRRRAEPRAAAW